MAADEKKFKTIDEYIQVFPKDVQSILEKIRQTVATAAPGAVGMISYQIPAFKLDKVPIAYFAAFKNHIGLYPPTPIVFKDEVAPYKGPKGNLKFPIDEPVPYDLIKRIVEYRVNAIAGKKT